MPVAHLEIPDGELIPPITTDISAVISRLLVVRASEVKLLEPGEYDITPAIWTKHVHDHELVVLDNGTGVYRMRPRHQDSGFHEISQEHTRLREGGKHVPINGENPLAVIAGGHPRKSDLHIFGLIAYLSE